MRWRIELFIEDVKLFFRAVKAIPSLAKMYLDYEYDGETVRFIIENYTQVLCNRTKVMSKPTYHYKDVISQIDEWYEDE